METRNVQRRFGVLNRRAHCNLKKKVSTEKGLFENTTSRLIKTNKNQISLSSYWIKCWKSQEYTDKWQHSDILTASWSALRAFVPEHKNLWRMYCGTCEHSMVSAAGETPWSWIAVKVCSALKLLETVHLVQAGPELTTDDWNFSSSWLYLWRHRPPAHCLFMRSWGWNLEALSTRYTTFYQLSDGYSHSQTFDPETK